MGSNGDNKSVLRRPSASTSGQQSRDATISKMHRSNESHHGFVGSHPSAQSPLGFTPTSAPGSPQSKAVLALIKRLTIKLPCYSGVQLGDLEADNAMLHIIETLVELAKHALDIIVWKLSQELESLAKQQLEASGQRALHILQSELFLLKVMSVILSCRWQHKRTHHKPSVSSMDRMTDSVASSPALSSSPLPGSSGPSSQSQSKHGMGRGGSTGSVRSIAPSLSLEAPPLDENCARWLVSVMLMLLRQAAPRDDRTKAYDNLSPDATLYGFESINAEDGLRHEDDMPWMPLLKDDATNGSHLEGTTGGQWPKKATSMNSVSSGMSTPIPLKRSALGFQRTPRTLTMSSLPLYSLITEWAGFIVYLLSAVNWNVVLAKIRGKIHSLARTAQEDFQDYTDLQLMQHCAMDRTRLIQLLQELSSLLVNMRPEAHCAAAIAVRHAIWNWIETFPSEFYELQKGTRKLDGAPERVFDAFHQIKTDQNRKVLWPALNLLLFISYERFAATCRAADDRTKIKTAKKEIQFLEDIRKNLDPASKACFTSALCVSDTLRAVSFIPPEHDVIARLITGDMADALSDMIMKISNQRPFFDSVEPIDISFYADCLVAIARVVPDEEFLRILHPCLEAERSYAVKIVAVKALIILSQQANKWPHLRPYRSEYLIERIKRLVQASSSLYNERDSLGVMRRSAQHPTMRRFSSETITERELLTISILCLYRYDARFFPLFDEAQDLKDWVGDIVTSYRDLVDPAVTLSCVRTFAHQMNWMMSRPPEWKEFKAGMFWGSITAPLFIQVCADRLLDCRDNLFEQRMVSEMLCYGVSLYRKALEVNATGDWDYSGGRLPAVISAEIALLVTLTSTDTIVSTIAAKGLRDIAIAEGLPNPLRPEGGESPEALKRYPLYEQIGDPSFVAVGRVAQQRRIRKFLKLLTNPSPLHAVVWVECYHRWAALRDWIINRHATSSDGDVHSTYKPSGDLTMSPEERFYQWQNLTLFMASYGAVSVSEDLKQTLLDRVPLSELPDRLRVTHDGNYMLTDFLTTTVDTLLFDIPMARDTAKEALGTELHPRLFTRLFKLLHEMVDDVARTSGETPTGEPEEALLLVFFEQLLAVLKLIIDRQDVSKRDLAIDYDMRHTILTLGRFMERFKSGEILRFKLKYCQFIESSSAQASKLEGMTTQKDSMRYRNQMIDILIDWFDPEGTHREDLDHIRLGKDVNLAVLRAIASLVERVKLVIIDGSAGDDPTHAISRRYLRIQNALLQGLQFECPASMVGDEDRSSQYSSGHSAKMHSATDKGTIYEMVTNGLAHLLASNTEVGLKHFLPLGYENDLSKRAIFCKATSRVMELGGRLSSVSEAPISTRQSEIGALVKGCDLFLVLAICETCPPSEDDIIIPVLLNLFDTRTSLLDLLKLLIEREVKSTSNDVALFRGNTMRVKLLCAFAKVHGYEYLRQLIKPLLDKMYHLPPNITFQLDPAKATDAEVRENQETIKIFADAFLHIVCNSAPVMPMMLREVCAHISSTVAEVWPDAKFTALGAFIFLRFISPALVAPETIDFELPPDNVAMRRGLLIITKIIQNLANNVRFGKEVHMMCFNEFLQSNILRVMRFLTDVNKPPAAIPDEIDEWQGGEFDETHAIVLHRFFEKHADKVGKELLSLSKSSKEGEAAVVGGKKAWDTLCAALVEMGQPLEIPRLTQETSATYEVYREFMIRMADRSTDAVAPLFREIAITDRTVVYLLPMSQIESEILDYELLAYHVFKTLATHEDSDIELVIDSTNHTSSSEIPIEWCKYFIDICPSDIRERFKVAYVLNCNMIMQRFLRKLYNVCSGIFSVELKPKFGVEDLCKSLGRNVAVYLDTAWTLEQEEKELYEDVMLRQGNNSKVPVVLQVAQSHLRIISAKAQTIYRHLSCKTVEVIPFQDIGDIYNVSTGRDVNEFIIRRNRNGGTLYFSSEERDDIVKSIRGAKIKMVNTRTVQSDKTSRLSNIHAALLSIGLLNSYNELPDLKGAAYDLVRAICSSINFSEADTWLPSSGGFIPGDSFTVVDDISAKIAAFAPELTLDFIYQVCLELERPSNTIMKGVCGRYMNPWIRNLSKFCDPTNKLYELSGARLRDCIRMLLDLTVRDQEFCYCSLRLTWPAMGRCDTAVVNVALDEIMRTAVDGGIGSTRCETMVNVLSAMASKSAKGRILAKLRKALGKTSTKPSKTLDRNAHWNEISAYSRLALSSSNNERVALQSQILAPEVLHVVTLLACQGDVTMRSTIYGLALQLLQSMHQLHTDDTALQAEIRSLLAELERPEIVRLFGITRASASCEFTLYDASDDRIALEKLSQWLLRAASVCSGNTGIINVWRARWMGLLTSTAFQLSPSVQPRAFVVMGTLAHSDVDDDLLYQMLVALRSAMKSAEESDTHCVVSMLNCICNVVPSLPESSRYIGTLFWFAVALLQSSHAPFYTSANELLCACIETLHSQGAFEGRGFTATLLEARSCLEDIHMQLDQILQLNFDSDFSFSLAAPIFKGIRRPPFRDSAIKTLRCLLTTTVSTMDISTTEYTTVHRDILGYFIALLSVSTDTQTYQQLLQEACVGSRWITQAREPVISHDNVVSNIPRVPFELLGCQDSNTALLAISFLGSILSSAQVDDVESQMLFALLREACSFFPKVVCLVYDGLQDKIHDVFTTSTNSAILSSASIIFRIAMADSSIATEAPPKGSMSSLGTVDEDNAGSKQLSALEELNMQGLANTFQFLPANRGHVKKILNWFPELITKIIE